ncbi:C2 factor (C2F)-like protein [Leptotrombidium deliense]|uniref:18S rRNA (pseudouridine-N1)-methyltransferase n=1 Tax=Leptotrombidium deliense TaxID=299467 RepID=A0A443SGI0_9ACAR|nr:C2 factor (C2F)-like protein [Leptotrombidium deliense]
MSSKRKNDDNETGEHEQETHESVESMHPHSVPKDKQLRQKLFKNAKNDSQRLIIILEKANLEAVSLGKKFELLNCDDHMNQIRKYKKDPAFCRPDITHQCLLMLFDSPLNRAGLLQVFIHTQQNILIEIDPQTRLPRTFKRFANLMVQLLHKLGIRSTNGPNKLMKVIKNPITSHLPIGCRKIGTTFQSKNLVHPKDLVPSDDSPVAIVIGAMAHGQVDVDYVEDTVSISQYPLSAALACTKIVSAFEEAWGIH